MKSLCVTINTERSRKLKTDKGKHNSYLRLPCTRLFKAGKEKLKNYTIIWKPTAWLLMPRNSLSYVGNLVSVCYHQPLGNLNVCTFFQTLFKINIIIFTKQCSILCLSLLTFSTSLIVRSHPSSHRLATLISDWSALWIKNKHGQISRLIVLCDNITS